MLLGAAQGSFWLPPEASNFAGPVDQLFHLIYWSSVILFIGIVAVMLYFCWKYRRTEGREAEKTPTHHTVLELTWSIPPLFLVLFFFWVGFQDYEDMVTPPADAYEIQVTARAYGWEFTYPNGGSSGELLLPDDRPVS